MALEGGVFDEPEASFNLQNKILAGNFETLAIPVGPVFIHIPTPADCAGTINSLGENLKLVPNCTVSGSALAVADPMLAPLQNNGGPTQTHALLAGSPAIEAGNPLGCRINLARCGRDQRGAARHFDGDGKTDLVVYNPASAGWSIIRSADSGFTYKVWGGLVWGALPGDYAGD